MKKTGTVIIGLAVVFAFVTGICAQTSPRPDKQPPQAPFHVGNVVTLKGTTLAVTGGKGGQTAFNIATAKWQGYASLNEVRTGDRVKVTYMGMVDGLKKATAVQKQGASEIKPIHKGSTSGGRR